jgi:predicted Rossmann fold flavoprotein
MCAIEAGKRGRRVAVLEHADRLGKKILISGGGRCNFTNLHCQPENFLSANPHFAKSALARYTPEDFIALVEKHRIPYHEKTLGQLFCDRSARDILGMLEEECRVAGVEIFLNVRIREVSAAAGFTVRTADEEFQAATLVVACGGLSIPKIGATAFGYELARKFGIRIREPWPGLVPVLLDPQDRSRYCDLAGVSAEVVASCDGQQFREKMLITHRGLSGPAILQISSYWKKPQLLTIDLAPGNDATGIFRDPKNARTESLLRSELERFCPAGLRIAGWNCTLSTRGRTPLWPTSSTSCTRGISSRPAPKDSIRPKSLPEGLTPTNFRPRPWNHAKFPACSSLARWLTSQATLADSTSSGRGLPGRRQDELCDASFRITSCSSQLKS